MVHVRAYDAPPPPPGAPGAYKKKGEESGGVVAMVDPIIAELDMEMTEAETEEKLAQEEYEELIADSTEKRATDSKSLADKGALKADTEDELVKQQDEHKSTVKDAECDWLIQYFDVRKEACTGEIDALGKAKAQLYGADFSFLQVKSVKFIGCRLCRRPLNSH